MPDVKNVRNREQALALAQELIENCHRWEAQHREFQRGHFSGLTGAWWLAGFITKDDMVHLRWRLNNALEKVRPTPWWDLSMYFTRPRKK